MRSLSRVLLFATPWAVACTRLLHPWDFLGKSSAVGCHFLLQVIFPTQGSNPCLPHCTQMLYHLSHQGRPSFIRGPKKKKKSTSRIDNTKWNLGLYQAGKTSGTGFFSLKSSFIFTWNDFTWNQLPFLGRYKVTSTLSEDRLPPQTTWTGLCDVSPKSTTKATEKMHFV